MNPVLVDKKINQCAGSIINLLESQRDFSVSWKEQYFNAVSCYSAFQVSFQDGVISIRYHVKTDYHNHDGTKTKNVHQECIAFKPIAMDVSSGVWIYLSKPDTITKQVTQEDGTTQVSYLSEVILKLESEELTRQFGLLIKKLGLLLRSR